MNMNSKETSRLIIKSFYICLLFIFIQCTFSQPVLTNLLKAEIKNNDDGNAADSIWIRPLSYSDSGELNSEDNNSEELLQLLSKYLVDNEQNEHNRASLSSPVRRANFWKRANFWRKRANFWRRDLITENE